MSFEVRVVPFKVALIATPALEATVAALIVKLADAEPDGMETLAGVFFRIYLYP